MVLNRENQNTFSRLWLTLALFFMLLALKLFSYSPRLVEQLYSNTLFPPLVTLLTRLNSQTLFSFSELTVFSVLFIFSFFLIKLLFNLLLDFRASFPAAVRFSLALLNLLLAAVFLGYVLWGLNYSRPTFTQRVEWAAAEIGQPVSQDEELSRLALETLRWTNHFYRLALGGVDSGEPSRLPESLQSLDERLNSGFAGASGLLDLPEGLQRLMGPAKPLFSSPLMSYLGLSGFYYPWTGEANFNDRVPDCELPLVIAHEKAHQRAFASEDEASFAGFLACLYSGSAYARYSAYLFAQRQLFGEWFRVAPVRARAATRERLPGVQRDLEAVGRFWDRHHGVLSEVTSSLNDSYLQLHRVKGGIRSYGRSASLLVLLGRYQNGSLAPPSGAHAPVTTSPTGALRPRLFSDAPCGGF